MLLGALIVAAVVSVSDVPKPGLGDSKVVDTADMLSPAEEGLLDARIAGLERDLGVESAIVTVPDVAGTAKDFATDLFNRWGIGKQDARNGLLIVVVRDKRRIATEVGYGLEPLLPDGWLAAIQKDTIGPHFRSGRYGEGLMAGFGAIEDRLRANPEEAREGARRIPGASGAASGTWAWIWPLGAGLAGLGIAAFLVARARRRKVERCPRCKGKMILLDEVADDAYLAEGERREEQLDSVNYKVWICPVDQATTIRKEFGPVLLDSCPKCHYATLRRVSATVEEATYEHGGQVRVAEKCEHCGFERERTRRTRRRTRPDPVITHSGGGGSSFWWIGGPGIGWGSSSSGGWSDAGGDSSGGFSFGGGDSGGGGADTGW